jgi:hypothetical protein
MRPDDNGHGNMSETTPQQKANLARIRYATPLLAVTGL